MHFLCLIISHFPMVIHLTVTFSIVGFYLSYFLYVYSGMLKVKLIYIVIPNPVLKKWHLFPLFPLSLKIRQRFIILVNVPHWIDPRLDYMAAWS